MTIVRRTTILAVFAFVILPCLGCGGGKTVVNGKLLHGGKAVTTSEKGMVIMNFTAKNGEDVYSADVKSNGTFEVKGRDGGIPPGEYRVSVQWFDPYTGSNDVDKLRGTVTGKSGPMATVESGKELVIDLAKAKGS